MECDYSNLLINKFLEEGQFMKTVLIGCGIILLIAIIVGVYLCYHVVQFTKDFTVEIADIEDQFKALNSEIPFVKPRNDLIPKDRFEIWIGVRHQLSNEIDAMGDLFEDFSLKSIPGIKSKLFEIAKVMVVELDTVSMSPQEYVWIMRQTVGVLTSGDARQVPELVEVIEEFEALNKKGQHIKSDTDLDDISLPVTSKQIAHTLPLLVQNKEALIETIKVFYADMVLFSMMGMTFQEEQGEGQAV